ncbi:uncharacterized protein V1518DRAFT_419132 [Limtongia smithiae]|uniref:uncharacterized protein n=1 Tax=Limtongia smithiae TaxID=1125753 RepID=UPI0034CD8DC9
MKFALNLGNMTMNGPAIIRYRTSSYSTAQYCPQGFDQIDWYHNLLAERGLQTPPYMELMRTAQQLYTQLQEVSQFYTFYNFLDPVAGTRSYLRLFLQDVDRWLLEVSNNPTRGNIRIFNVDLSQFARRTINFRLELGNAYGGNGGTPFSDINETMILDLVYLEKIDYRYGIPFDQITTQYRYLYDRKISFSNTHGLLGGNEMPTVEIDRAVQISSIEFYKPVWKDSTLLSGIILRSRHSVIEMGTNFNNSCGFDNAGGNRTFVGFAGRADKCVDQLRPIYVVFVEPSVFAIEHIGEI